MMAKDTLYHEDTNFLEMEHWNGFVKVYCEPVTVFENGDREYRMVFCNGFVKTITITPDNKYTCTFLVEEKVNAILEEMAIDIGYSGNIDTVDADLRTTKDWLKKHFGVDE